MAQGHPNQPSAPKVAVVESLMVEGENHLSILAMLDTRVRLVILSSGGGSEMVNQK